MDVVFVTLRSLSFEYGRQDSVLKLGYMLIEWIYDVSILSQSKKKKFIFKLDFDQILKIIINFTWQAHTSYNIIRQFLKVLLFMNLISHLLNISHCHYLVWQGISNIYDFYMYYFLADQRFKIGNKIYKGFSAAL